MQVMNSTEFEQTEVLIGQQGTTEGFGVSTDASLMSMLSTGLYKNPHRTMIQEILFNAWDAHRMGNCQDRPIDVYVNDTTGLIVRDYGPGIAHDQMHPIYCIYGNSTKRDDKGSTGGFGLGSKSPFAYTESFTVTSHHQGKKSMYLISRASDDNQGKPGMTPIIRDASTDESGLMVTVPLKEESHLVKTFEYIEDVLYLSGIKANVHLSFSGSESEELYEAEAVSPGTWRTDTKKGQGVYAVYGGVRYLIERHDLYGDDYDFLYQMSKNLGRIHIGFEPDSLTPLPSREGLNFGDKATETITTVFSGIKDDIEKAVMPAMKLTLIKALDEFAAQTKVAPEFLLEPWTTLAHSNNKNLIDMMYFDDLTGWIAENVPCPDDVLPFVWESVVVGTVQNTRQFRKLMPAGKFERFCFIPFAKKFPEFLKYLGRDGTLKEARFNHYSRIPHVEDYFEAWCRKAYADMKHLRELLGQKDLGYRLLLGNSSNWQKVSFIRGAGKLGNNRATRSKHEKLKRLTREGKIELPTTEVNNSMWMQKDGKKFSELMLDNVIILAKTATALNESEFEFQKEFCDYDEKGTRFYNHRFNFGQFVHRNNYEPIPAMIVNQRNGNYETAKAYFESKGFKVLEADEPEAKKKPEDREWDALTDAIPVTSRTQAPAGYTRLSYSCGNHYQGELMEGDPEAYFCSTMGALDSGYSSDRPDRSFIHMVTKRWPNTTLLLNKSRAAALDRKGIPHISALVEAKVKSLAKNPERLKRMALQKIGNANSQLPQQIMELPEVQKMFGIPYTRTNQKKRLEEDMNFLRVVSGEHHLDTIPTDLRCLARNLVDPDISMAEERTILKACEKTQIFNEYQLRDLVRGMKPGEIKCLSEKLMRLLKTI